MTKDTTGTTHGILGQTFTLGEKVMVRRLGDGNEYRAKIAGIGINDVAKVMIIEIVDPLSDDYEFTHCVMTEVCIDKETW